MQIMYGSYKDQRELNIWCMGNCQDENEEPSNATATKCDQKSQDSYLLGMK